MRESGYDHSTGMATKATKPAAARRQQPGRTRAAILERAVDLASTEGLEGLTIGRLATELELSKSGLFGHFGSKEELQLATIEEASRRFVEEVIQPSLSASEGQPRLRALADSYLGYVERGVFAGGCFFAAVSVEFDDRPGPVGDRVRAAVGAWLGYLEEQARSAGAADPELLAFELHALGQGANSSFRLFGDPLVFRRARRAIDHALRDQIGSPGRRQALSRAK